MTDHHDGSRPFPLKDLFAGLEQRTDERSSSSLTRNLTEKERGALQGSKLAAKTRYFLERRADNGNLHQRRLRDALRTKRERFSDSEFINTGPVGPGCNWLSVGPRNINGRIKCLAVHPTDGNTLYAGAANGGVWKTEDGGQSWTPKMHDQDSLAIGALAIDPSDPDVIYAGTGEAVYFFSTSPTPLPPGADNLAWYYEGVGVYRSSDGGDTWTLTGAIENEHIYQIAVDPFNANHLLCAGYSLTPGQGGLCRSTDGGTSWTTIQNGIFTDVLFDPNNANRIYAASYNGGVIKSTDGGVIWNPRNTGLPATTQIGRVSLTLARANSQVLYAMIEDDSFGSLLGVYRTGSAAEAPGWTGVSNPNVDLGFVWWCQFIAADPADATGDKVYAGSVHVAVSVDGGTNWTRATDEYGASKPSTHADQHDLVFDPSDNNHIYTANDGGIFDGNYTGAADPVSWKKVSTGLVVTQFYDLHASPASPTMFGGGAQDNGSMITTGGQSWRHVYGADGGYVAFHPTDPYTVYIQTQGAGIRQSTDGANTFSYAASGIGGVGIFPATVMAIDTGNPMILFAGTNRVYRTTNGGGSWSPASGAIGKVSEVTIAPSSSNTIYAGTVTGTLYRATDGGVTATSFSDITPGVAGWPSRWLAGIAVHPTDPDTIYVSFLGFNGSVTNDSDHVWKGAWDGVSWTWNMISSGLPDVPAGAIAYHPATADLYLATDIGVFRSDNDGASWSPFEAGLPNTAVVDLHLDPARNLLRVATHGRGMYQMKLGAPCPRYDIYVRDNILDTGEVLPSPSGVPDPTQPGKVVRHYKSADIKVDAQIFDPVDSLTDGVEFDDPEHPYTSSGGKIEDIAGIEHNKPIRDRVNRVYVQVHNRGWDQVASCTVKLMYADAGAGLPALPADFWPAFPADPFDQTNWKPIGTSTVSDLLPNVPHVLSFNWTPPLGTSDHVCLLALIDSPDDPILPETELNVDMLTLNNKRSTHRNVHPVDPPPGPAPFIRWTGLNFHNGFQNQRIFDIHLERFVGSGGGIRMLLDKPRLRVELEDLQGVEWTRVDREALAKELAVAGENGEISAYTAKLAASMEEPVAFIAGGKDLVLPALMMEANEAVPALFQLQMEGDLEAPFSFEVNQYSEEKLIGGSEFVVKPRGCRLRIVLEKVTILDDKDKLFGKGEFVFRTRVGLANQPAKTQEHRFPEKGCYRISDQPGKNEQELEEIIFEGFVPHESGLHIALDAKEYDFIKADYATFYRLALSGNPKTWLGFYGPSSEPMDPEAMKDWQVHFRIEEI